VEVVRELIAFADGRFDARRSRRKAVDTGRRRALGVVEGFLELADCRGELIAFADGRLDARRSRLKAVDAGRRRTPGVVEGFLELADCRGELIAFADGRLDARRSRRKAVDTGRRRAFGVVEGFLELADCRGELGTFALVGGVRILPRDDRRRQLLFERGDFRAQRRGLRAFGVELQVRRL